ncbi:unnamed protein product [Ectocarpus sp. 8 AP-2014]
MTARCRGATSFTAVLFTLCYLRQSAAQSDGCAVADIGNGLCDEGNNNVFCSYDGGDCCYCTCSGALCQSITFDCLDPDADDEFYECEAPPPTALPCSAEVQQTWVVDDSAQAQALASAVNCSGGSFEVEWRGTVVVESVFYVVDGTTLSITGDGSSAAIDGNAATRLFTVVNAALHLTGVDVTSGASTTGGAIAAAGATLTLNQTNFLRNTATGDGGAIFLSDGSSMVCSGGGAFTDNEASVDGGALYVTGGSVVSCGGLWFGNVAGDSAGAIIVDGESSLSWSEDAIFGFNLAETWGGAVYARSGASVSWNASTRFFSNTVGSLGGALAIVNGSTASWIGETTFESNYATSTTSGIGGALVVYVSSSAFWSGVTTFKNNTAEVIGGAVWVADGSQASCTGDETISTFSGNSAENGGAIVSEDSGISFEGNFSFDSNRAVGLGGDTGHGGAFSVSGSTVSLSGEMLMSSNSAVQFGGAIFSRTSQISWAGETALVENSGSVGGAVALFFSELQWSGDASFSSNYATEFGGALYVSDSSAAWSGNTLLLNNSAIQGGGAVEAVNATVVWSGHTEVFNNSAEGFAGGGMDLSVSSTVEWSGNTTFAHNRAVLGGALFASGSSSVFWSEGATVFRNNSAIGTGGGAIEVFGAMVSWSGDTEFTGNMGPSGSAVVMTYGSSGSWSGGTTIFADNNASLDGTVIVDNSTVSWSGATEFIGNSAESRGGALLIRNGANVSWTGDTNFVSNKAVLGDGGAVATNALSTSDSTLFINGTTIFSDNSAGGNGGGIALFVDVALNIGTVDVSFVGNSAGVAGGAMFVSGVSIGPRFNSVSFVSNSAEIGGGISIFGSGTDESGDLPTTFDTCQFIGNQAISTGGAINSAAGEDAIENSVFEGNSAGTGGALRLAGEAYISNCSFLENTSDEGEGAAVSNIGFISSITNVSFDANGFDCPAGTFLNVTGSGDHFEAICNGCDTTCDGCVFAEGSLAPICTEVMDHSTSDGGNVTLQTLSIDRGFWRASASSTEVLACYHADACLGGVTGASGYCEEGYEGPCASCSITCSLDAQVSCRTRCQLLRKLHKAGGCFPSPHLIGKLQRMDTSNTQPDDLTTRPQRMAGIREGGIVERVTRYIPLQSLKIVIVSWQILTQFTSVANVTYPDVYQELLDVLDVFNFDLSWLLSAGCVVDMNFHDRLLVSTISPIVALLLLACTYAAAARANRGDPEKLNIIWNKHVTMVLLLTFFVYSSVSSTLFRAFACDDLDYSKYYLRADYSIECDSSEHRGIQVYAGFMIVIYTMGIPSLYAELLFKNRDVLKDEDPDREEPPRVKSISNLWEPYKPAVFYYEVIECFRRVLLAGVVVFIYPNTAAQIAVTLLIAFAFALLSEGLAPYASRWDAWISRIGHIVVFLSMYVALLLKVDVSDERASSQEVFEGVLVAVHVCMILVVLVEAAVQAWSLRKERRALSTAPPRFRSGKSLTRNP